MLLLVPDGPFRKRSQQLDLSAFLKVFQNKKFRKAAFGYFGHMWELYTFWAFVPVMLLTYQEFFPGTNLNVPFWSFLIIGSGGAARGIIGPLLDENPQSLTIANRTFDKALILSEDFQQWPMPLSFDDLNVIEVSFDIALMRRHEIWWSTQGHQKFLHTLLVWY